MEEQQFILRWHYHETTLLRNLPRLLEAEILTDITLSADNKIIKAHKIILATCSSYFLQLFQNMGYLQHPLIILHNTSYEDLRCLMSFIYKGHCFVTKKQLPSLIALAKLLQIQGLCDMKLPQEDSNIYQQNMIQNPLNNFSVLQNTTEKTYYDEPRPPPTVQQYKKQETASESHIESSSKKLSKDFLYKCFLCGKYLSNQYNLRVHMETHEEGCYMCQSCPHVSRSRDALRKHVSYRHQEQYALKRKKNYK